MDFTAIALNLIGAAQRFGFASAVDMLEGFIEDTLAPGVALTVAVLLQGANPEDMQEWLDENE